MFKLGMHVSGYYIRSPTTLFLDKWEENNPLKKLSETVEPNNPSDDYLTINPPGEEAPLPFQRC